MDTNVLSETAKPKPSSGLVDRLRAERGRVAMSAAVWNELILGLRRLPQSKRRHTLERYIRDVLEPTVPVLPYDARAAEWHAIERARLGALGRTPAYVDGSIAAVAHTNQLVLVTHNLANYEDFEGLELEDWSRSSLGIKSGDKGF